MEKIWRYQSIQDEIHQTSGTETNFPQAAALINLMESQNIFFRAGAITESPKSPQTTWLALKKYIGTWGKESQQRYKTISTIIANNLYKNKNTSSWF